LLAVAVIGGLAAAGWAAAVRRWGSAEWVVLLAWVAATVAFSVLGTPTQAARHLLPAFPPLTVLVLRLLGPLRRATHIALAVLLAIQGGTAYLVAAADAEVADAGRQFARYAAENYKGSGQDVWFNGHGGWQHYAQAQGFRQISASGVPPAPGAIVLEPKWVDCGAYPRGLAITLVEVKTYETRCPVQTLDAEGGGFYAVTLGRMPYSFTLEKRPAQVGQVFRVEAPHR